MAQLRRVELRELIEVRKSPIKAADSYFMHLVISHSTPHHRKRLRYIFEKLYDCGPFLPVSVPHLYLKCTYVRLKYIKIPRRARVRVHREFDRLVRAWNINRELGTEHHDASTPMVLNKLKPDLRRSFKDC